VSSEILKTKSIVNLIIDKLSEDNSDFRKINLDGFITSTRIELTNKMSSFSEKEKIKCINVVESTDELTLNKTYEVLSSRMDVGSLKVDIINDVGSRKSYYYRNFESITELRDSFLSDILGDL
jgi:hypothetical protein